MSKVLKITIGVLLALVILAGVFSAGVLAGQAYARLPVGLASIGNAAPGASEAGTPQDLVTMFKPFWQTWTLVNQIYVDQPVNQRALMRGAIKGMMDSLGDQHTSYMDPEMFKQVNENLQGEEYEGIGAWVDPSGDYLTIISPMPGSPAEKAGLMPRDKILAIDRVDMTGIDGEAVRQKVLGPKGSTVHLTILRQGVDKPLGVDVVRGSIVVPTVTSKMLDNGIAYVHLYTYGDTTADDLKKELTDLMKQHPKGLILDLRNNGGGLLNTAIEVVSQFIDGGTVMYEEYGDGSKKPFAAQSGGIATDIPMVVLVNHGSASASEITAGAIQDRARGYLVGETSYGKGSVQSYITLDNGDGAVRITVAHWLTPNGRQIHKIGLTPDFPVELTPEDAASGKDPQLDEAEQVLLQKLVPLPTAVPSPTPTVTPLP